MKILAFDTSTDVCSVAAWVDGSVYEVNETGRRHGERILVLVDQVLAQAGIALNNLDTIAFGRGPGSFTGLRIGAGVAQGLAFGADLPVVPVSSLAALAQGVACGKVLAAFDARMQQVYWGNYVKDETGLAVLRGEEVVCAPSEVPLLTDENWEGAGSGWEQYTDALLQRVGSRVSMWHADCYPWARCVAELSVPILQAGKAVAAEHALPVYIRDNVAVKSEQRRQQERNG